MPDLIRRVQSFAARHRLWAPDTPVLAAVSGGSDSVALALLLHRLSGEGWLTLVGLAHLHHHIRGAEADGDAQFVSDLARRLGVPCEVGHVDVPALARATGRSLEVAARHARLEFLEGVRASSGAEVVAMAHTRGDQAETVLLRLARGAGPRGLSGMAPRTERRIRPLLDIGREELRSWLRQLGEPWREDATNEDVAMARNRVRHEVMPALRAINPGAEAAVARAARILAADAALLDELARAEAARIVEWRDGRASLDLPGMASLPDALARRLILATLETLDPSRTYGWEETEEVLTGSTPRTEVGGVRLERNGRTAVLSSRTVAAPDEAGADGGPWILSIPGTARHPSGWWHIEAAGPMAPAGAPAPSADRAVVDAGALGRHLTIRGWRAGDRVQPLGMRGRRKLQDVFVDRKVPRGLRRMVPVVLDEHERIVWVAGHVVGEPFRVTPRSSAVVVLTLRR